MNVVENAPTITDCSSFVRRGLDVRSTGEGDREKMSRRPVLQNLKTCDFYEKETHMCLADGTSICLDPHLAKEEDCETAKDAKKLDQVIRRNTTKLDDSI